MATEDSRAPRLYLYLRIIQLFFACLLGIDFCLARINISPSYTHQQTQWVGSGQIRHLRQLRHLIPCQRQPAPLLLYASTCRNHLHSTDTSCSQDVPCTSPPVMPQLPHHRLPSSQSPQTQHKHVPTCHPLPTKRPNNPNPPNPQPARHPTSASSTLSTTCPNPSPINATTTNKA